MTPPDPIENALQRVRLYWWSSIFVIAPLPFVVTPIAGASWVEVAPQEAYASAKQFTAMVLILGAALAAAGLLARNQAYKAQWQGDVVTPAGYTRGNALFFGLLVTGAVLIAAAGVSLGYPAPTFTAAPVYLGLLIFNRPNGKPMQPQPPRFGDDGDTP